MKIDLKGLLEGMKNSFLPAQQIKEEIEETSQERLAICNQCPYYSPNAKSAGYETNRPDVFCTNCGCNLHFKSRCLSCACPQDKWKAHITEGEEDILKKRLNEQQSNP